MKLYIDMDGVLCNFVKGACDLFCQHVDTATHWGFHEDWGVSEKEFWEVIGNAGEDFWINLEPFWWTEKLLSIAKEIDPDYYICSSPGSNASAYSGKFLWLEEYIDRTKHRIILMKNKWELAKPNRILIDDKDGTINNWIKCGGYGIWWPEVTNNCTDSIESKLRILEEYRE